MDPTKCPECENDLVKKEGWIYLSMGHKIPAFIIECEKCKGLIISRPQNPKFYLNEK